MHSEALQKTPLVAATGCMPGQAESVVRSLQHSHALVPQPLSPGGGTEADHPGATELLSALSTLDKLQFETAQVLQQAGALSGRFKGGSFGSFRADKHSGWCRLSEHVHKPAVTRPCLSPLHALAAERPGLEPYQCRSGPGWAVLRAAREHERRQQAERRCCAPLSPRDALREALRRGR